MLFGRGDILRGVTLTALVCAAVVASACADTVAAPKTAPAPTPAPAPATETAPDVLDMTGDEIRAALKDDPAALGSVSLGRPNGGALFGAVAMPSGDAWHIVDERHAWATEETVGFLVTAIRATDEKHPGDKLFIGQLSRDTGGKLWPHASHQSGRDVDLSYYYLPGTRGGWYQRAAKVNLDCKRTWALIRAFIVHTDVEHIFISRSVQRLLRAYALESGEDPEWLQSIFDHKSVHPSPLIRDVMGHITHMHVRFFNPRAQHIGAHAHQMLSRKTKHHRRLLPPRDVPIPARRLPPDLDEGGAVTATN